MKRVASGEPRFGSILTALDGSILGAYDSVI